MSNTLNEKILGSHVWEVEMFKNVGTVKEPQMEWVKEVRYYHGQKGKTDFDLHDVENKRRNAKQLNQLTK